MAHRRSHANSREAPGTNLYSAGLLAVALVLCFTYSFIGIRRVAFGGIEVFTGDALLTSLALRSLEYGPFDFDYGLLPLRMPWLAFAAKIGFVVVTIFEILSPFVLISRRFRYAWLAVILSFHFATLFTMNIFFWENVVLILVFLTGATGIRLRERSEARRPNSARLPDRPAVRLFRHR